MATIETGIKALTDAGIFAYLIPFLLAIAIVYGILEHVSVPKDKSVRSLIAILAGFLVLPLGKTLSPFLEGLSLGLMVIVATVLALLVMAESTGLTQAKKEHVWVSHPKLTGVVFIMIALIIFVSAGGPKLIGLENVRLGGGLGLAFFLVIMALGVWWIAGEKKGG
ncbi:MAG: hypothetical protein HY366_02940 [Candidatus Aenigmarchaeota archaeon]|nr:hypothetical protein [Candidatus Aenigmarchaeota archaeon]